ncbi:MAG: putative NRPS-like protein biosynthetic cluster [Ramalina farinacea]|uniref:NRPS-like protein biosynthetic cluster n=1 Tax=Ramalina farinacea TaxID=258253 RepID=A0AA43QRN2_9LECA|nr:putative NRPS-like protein biosynthetic cluster [Ramalina farinacea]
MTLVSQTHVKPLPFISIKNQPSINPGKSRTSMLFEHVVSRDGHKPAVISQHGTLSYDGLNHRANTLARHLLSLNVRREQVVAVALERGIEYIIALLACWKIGAAYLPLDQSLPRQRMQYMIMDSKAVCLITLMDIRMLKLDHSVISSALCLDDPEFISQLRCRSVKDLAASPTCDGLAYIIYTSGSTGTPKGVAITHSNVGSLIADIQQSREIESFDRVLLFSPFCFDASIRDIAGALMTGASLYVPKEEEVLPGNLLGTIARRKITNSVITPSVVRTCKYETLPHLRTLVVAGESSTQSLINIWGAGRRLINAYGPTEATVCSTKRVYYNAIIPERSPVSSIGRPVLNTAISILDDEGVPVSQGAIGEICITGPGVSQRGYLNLPQLTAERFAYDDSRQCASYKTGDIGRILPCGEIESLGRKASTRQVKLNGQRIELGEVEEVLRSASQVLDVAVLVSGEASSRTLCAYVVPQQQGSAFCEDPLSNYLDSVMRNALPAYSIPSRIEFIEALPLSVNKKLDTKALLATTQNRRSTTTSSAHEEQITRLEAEIAVVLLAALDVPITQIVTPCTTYAELGGTSLQASVVLRHLNKSFDSSIGFGQFYRKRVSIRYLANLIQGLDSASACPQNPDLLKLARLPYQIANSVESCNVRNHHHVLLTGATGFLGSHILVELLRARTSRISCIVRAADDAMAHNRTKSALTSWGLWQDSFSTRYHAFCGDVSEPFLGLKTDDYLQLAKDVDTVYHSAAAVNFIAPYGDLEKANVVSTVEVLRFASTFTQKRLTYISTLSVFFGAGNKISRGREEPVEDLDSGIVTGYGQSKWVSEQLVLEYARLGGHALILRPGRLFGNTINYKCPPDDFTVRLLASVLELGVSPDLRGIGGHDWQIDLTPVDYCARLVHQLSIEGQTGFRHIINNGTISFEKAVGCLGRENERIPYADWIRVIYGSKYLAPLSSLFQEPISTEDKRSAFEVLLQTTMFRNSDYHVSVSQGIGNETRSLPGVETLLHHYLGANKDIFTSIE